jgi:hypothetical protein
MAPHFVTKECSKCHKQFDTSNNSDLCYSCTLDQVANGFPPEEGDFNTAGILSGTLTEAERHNLQQDLESVELGRTTQEEGEEEEPDDWEFDETEAARLGDEG